MNITVPFLNFETIHTPYEDDFKDVFTKAMKTGQFVGGPMVNDFETDFAQFCEAKHCIGLSSGTDAVRFALMASGVKKDDIVITVANTFIATTEAISQANADIAFVDIDEKTYNLSPIKLKEYLETKCEIKNGKTYHKATNNIVSAVVPVHLYGQIADMDAICDIAEDYHLIVVEDACQAHGAKYYSKRQDKWLVAGSIGKAAAFSFYPGKNLGAFGEGGAVTTNDNKVADTIKKLRDHGQSKKYNHEIEGYNGRLDAIQAGILTIKLAQLGKWNKERLSIAQRYSQHLSKLSACSNHITTPFIPQTSAPVFHLYVIRVAKRDKLQQFLSDKNISSGLHYPIPLHLQKAYGKLGYKKGDFPITEKVAGEIISLAIFPGLTEQQLEHVVNTIEEFFKLNQD